MVVSAEANKMETPFREETLEQFRSENAELRKIVSNQRKTLLSYESDKRERERKENSWWNTHKKYIWPPCLISIFAQTIAIPAAFLSNNNPLLIGSLVLGITLTLLGAVSVAIYLIDHENK